MTINETASPAAAESYISTYLRQSSPNSTLASVVRLLGTTGAGGVRGWLAMLSIDKAIVRSVSRGHLAKAKVKWFA